MGTNKPGRKASQKQFITYNDLSLNDRRFFSSSGLNHFIDIAGKLLSRRLNGSPRCDLQDQSYFSESDFIILNTLIGDILDLIGIHSNDRFGGSDGQHSFFCKQDERHTFPLHLAISRWNATDSKLRNRKYTGIIARNSKGSAIFSKDSFRKIPAAKKMKYGQENLSETETRAVGLLYMIELVWNTTREFRKSAIAASLESVLRDSFCLYSLLDESDRLASHARGGQQSSKRKDYSRATEIVENLVRKDSSISTHILTKRANQQMIDQSLDEDEVPGHRWISDKVRSLKKSLRGN